MSIGHILQVIKTHPAGFYKVFPKRNINNIYFDTPNLECLHDNLMGVSSRKKYRVRWYGENVAEIKAPKLEIKYKENMLGGKNAIAVDEFSLDDLSTLKEAVNKQLPLLFALQPVLLNSYTRSYWETRCGRYRITVDSTLYFHSLMHSPHFQKYMYLDNALIVELKYDQEDEQEVGRITKYLPFRLSKNSKYVTGVLMTK